MATLHYGERPSDANIITGAGRLKAILISHAQTTAQTCTLYDNTAASGTVLLTIHVNPAQSPCFLNWGRSEGPEFSTGLSYSAPNCEIAVWAVEL